MIARLLRAELPGENPGIEERGETHDDDALALGILVSSHLRISGRKKRMDERLNKLSRASGESALTGLDGLAVAAEEIVRQA